MNKEKRETLLETFGSLPEDPAGKKLKGITFGKPEVGDVRLTLHGTWAEMMAEQNLTGQRPIAIFEDTHRPDGTPMEIDALPEDTEDIRYVYAGQYLKDLKGAERYYTFSEQKWAFGGQHPIGGSAHYMLAYRIAKPTTLKDLVGEDGQKVVWLIEENYVTQAWLSTGYDGCIQHYTPSKSAWVKLEDITDHPAVKWSHSPFTAYADANEFKGGSDDN